jgi:tetratricopeptide (TPR) repeat protein
MIAERARAYFEQGYWESAAEEASYVLSQYRVSAISRIPALAVLGHLRVRSGDPDPDAEAFAVTIENPLTNVVNPNRVRLEIEVIEEKLRKGEVPKANQPDTIATLGCKYEELGQHEKALEYLKRALAGKGVPDAGILNAMGRSPAKWAIMNARKSST